MCGFAADETDVRWGGLVHADDEATAGGFGGDVERAALLKAEDFRPLFRRQPSSGVGQGDAAGTALFADSQQDFATVKTGQFGL